MCTAVSLNFSTHYFGRNLDLYYRYNEAVTLTPKGFALSFRLLPAIKSHTPILGMATLYNDYPLYYDAVNSYGLCIAALSFTDNAHYPPPKRDMLNLTPFELIPYLLCSCKNVKEAAALLGKINITDLAVAPELPNTPLHWLVADATSSITVEPLADGLKIYENPTGVLTNNPPFDLQLMLLQNHISLSTQPPRASLSPKIPARPYSLGMGAMGLPGDTSSPSRFVRGVFGAHNLSAPATPAEELEAVFHLLDFVAQPKGLTHTADGREEFTVYSSCIDTLRGIYFFTTYQNRTPFGVAFPLEEKLIKGATLLKVPIDRPPLHALLSFE